MKSEISVGLIGYGLAGRVFHAPLISAVPGLKLVKVVERRGQSSRQYYPWVEVVTEAEALFQDDRIDLIVVATPNTSHFDLTKRALEANKHVVVDKPFTPTAAEAQQLIDLSGRVGRVLSVFQNRRWDGDFQTVQKLIAGGYLGRLVEFESHFDRFRNYLKDGAWREKAEPGSGILFDLGSHLIDQALVLFGQPQALTADIRAQRQGETDDQFELILHYDSLKVSLKASMLVREAGPRFILHGTHGSFVKYGLDPQEDALKSGDSPATNPTWGQEKADQWGTLNSDLNGLHFHGKVETLPGAYQRYYQNIYEAISQAAPLLVPPQTAQQTIRLIELAFQSHSEKRTVAIDANTTHNSLSAEC